MCVCVCTFIMINIHHRDLLGHLTEKDLTTLERALCSAQGLGSLKSNNLKGNASTSHKLTRRREGSFSQRDSFSRRSSLSRRGSLSRADSLTRRGSFTRKFSFTRKGSFKKRGSFSRRNSMFEPETTHTVTGSHFPLLGPSWSSSLQRASRKNGGRTMQPLKQPSSSNSVSVASPDDKTSEDTPGTCWSTRSQQQRKHHKRGPAGFSSMNELLHKLFVTISGVADKLQSNYAEDLRIILKYVFELVLSEPSQEEEEVKEEDEEEEEQGEERLSIHLTSQPALRIPQGIYRTCLSIHSYSVHTSSSPSPPQGLNLSMTGLVMTQTVTPSRLTSRNCSFCQRAFSMTMRRRRCKFCGKVCLLVFSSLSNLH